MKKLWFVFPALLLIAGLVFLGCGGGGGDDGDGPGGGADITYTAVADGTADTETSTKITFTFSEAVTGLEASNITITAGTGEATKGALTGSEKAWELAIHGIEQGKVKVKITKEGIDAAVQEVDVYKVPDKLVAEFDDTDLPSTDGTVGKGLLGADIVAALNDAKPGSYLILYGTNAPGANYGIGKVINSAWAGKGAELKTPGDVAKGDDFEIKVLVADIKYALEILDYDEDKKWANGTITDGSVGFNLYNDVQLTKIALFEVDRGEDPPPPEPVVPPDTPDAVGNLGSFTLEGGNAETQKGWASNEVDGLEGPDIADFIAAKYIVLKVTNMPNANGLGGLQFTFQSDINNWAWRNFSNLKGDWVNFNNAASDITYIVVDLSQVSDWVTAQGNTDLTQVKVLFGEIQNAGTVLGAWLLPAGSYTKPANAVDFDSPGYGYLVKQADFDWDLEGDE